MALKPERGRDFLDRQHRREFAFGDGGFYVLRNASSHVVIDCGEVGMRGRGGHGHNDITSFELFLDGVNVITQEGVEVIVPPRHHAVVTAKVAVDPADLKTAKKDFESVLAGLEHDYVATPAGLGVAVACDHHDDDAYDFRDLLLTIPQISLRSLKPYCVLALLL